MNRTLSRALVVVAATTVLHPVVATAPATAGASCGAGTPFQGTASGITLGYNYDWWETDSPGPNTVTLTSSDTSLWLQVRDANCVSLCSRPGGTAAKSCTVDGPGLLNIAVRSGAGLNSDYTLTESNTAPSPVNPTAPACRDGIDNDLNGHKDYGDDAGCSSWSDTSESSPMPQACNVAASWPGCVGIAPGDVVQYLPVAHPVTAVAATHTVVGTVDSYRFALPNGGFVTAPCVVVTIDGSAHNACAAAGGTFVNRIATLVQQPVNEPDPAGAPLAAVRVCEARYTVTAVGFGVSEFPAYAVC